MNGYECEVCGLAECDLPDGVDPEFIFERDRGVTHCATCEVPETHENAYFDPDAAFDSTVPSGLRQAKPLIDLTETRGEPCPYCAANPFAKECPLNTCYVCIGSGVYEDFDGYNVPCSRCDGKGYLPLEGEQ